MFNTFRLPLILAAFAVAAASHALNLNYAGNGPLGGNNTTSLGYLGDDFNFAKSVTSTGKITLSDVTGANGLTITLPSLTTSALYSGTGSATGFGAFAGYNGSLIAGTTINTTSYGVYVQGTINAVPEPASMAVLAVGGLGLLRRRRKA